MTQLDIFRAFQGTPTVARKMRYVRPPIEERFDDFNAANPHVLIEMLRLARNRLALSETRIGVKALYEELRESIRVRKLGNWKLDNSLTASYARRLIELEPRLAPVIEIRRRKHAYPVVTIRTHR